MIPPRLLRRSVLLSLPVALARLTAAEATGERALRSLDGPLGDWWRLAVPRIRIIK